MGEFVYVYLLQIQLRYLHLLVAPPKAMFVPTYKILTPRYRLSLIGKSPKAVSVKRRDSTWVLQLLGRMLSFFPQTNTAFSSIFSFTSVVTYTAIVLSNIRRHLSSLLVATNYPDSYNWLDVLSITNSFGKRRSPHFVTKLRSTSLRDPHSIFFFFQHSGCWKYHTHFYYNFYE